MNLPADIIRAAYYMSNWDGSLETAENQGRVYTFYPVDFKLPMVAPKDIGTIAVEILRCRWRFRATSSQMLAGTWGNSRLRKITRLGKIIL